jgi:hypothetical protein
MTSGGEASTSVAITCIGGQSFGQFLVYIATFDFQCRHQGMRLAFGEDTELFKVIGNHPPAGLTKNDYDKFVRTALEAHDARATAGTSADDTTNRMQNYFLRHYSNFPVIRWGRTIYPLLIVIPYTLVALGSVVSLLLGRIMFRPDASSILLEILYILTFLFVSFYSGSILQVERQVCYVEIRENSVSKDMIKNFRKLRRLAVPYPVDARGAVENMRRILPSLWTEDSNTLLMPVMSIRTPVEDELASWLLLLNDLRGMLMASSFWSVPLGDSRIDWGMWYGIAAYIQARLQRAVTQRYLKDAKTGGVFWFRRYASHNSNYLIAPDRKFDLKSCRKNIPLLLHMYDFTYGYTIYSLSRMVYAGIRPSPEGRLM